MADKRFASRQATIGRTPEQGAGLSRMDLGSNAAMQAALEDYGPELTAGGELLGFLVKYGLLTADNLFLGTDPTAERSSKTGVKPGINVGMPFAVTEFGLRLLDAHDQAATETFGWDEAGLAERSEWREGGFNAAEDVVTGIARCKDDKLREAFPDLGDGGDPDARSEWLTAGLGMVHAGVDAYAQMPLHFARGGLELLSMGAGAVGLDGLANVTGTAGDYVHNLTDPMGDLIADTAIEVGAGTFNDAVNLAQMAANAGADKYQIVNHWTMNRANLPEEDIAAQLGEYDANQAEFNSVIDTQQTKLSNAAAEVSDRE